MNFNPCTVLIGMCCIYPSFKFLKITEGFYLKNLPHFQHKPPPPPQTGISEHSVKAEASYNKQKNTYSEVTFV